MKKTRLIALANILAITASTFSPLYAASTPEELRQKEAALTERAVTVSVREIDLEDMQKTLSRRSAELDEQSNQLQAQRAENSVREVELQDLIAKYNKDTALLASQNAELDRDREQVDALRAELDRKSLETERVAREAADKLERAEYRERLADSREQELTRREEEIADSLSKLNIERAALSTARQENEADRLEIQNKREALDRLENDLNTAREIFAREKAQLVNDKAALKAAKAEAARETEEARKLKAEADEKARQAEAILGVNATQKARIAELEREIQSKSVQITVLLHDKELNLVRDGIGKGLPRNVSTQESENGLINWSDGSVRAKGFGLPQDGTKGRQAEALARRAAVVDLQRNILEMIQGVRIDSKTTVKNFMLESDRVEAAVNGMVRLYEIIDEKWDGEAYEVYGVVRQENIAKALEEVTRKIGIGRPPKEPKPNGASFTGMIIDARHLPLEQQKLFHIVDEAGKMVYGIEYVDRNVLSQVGLCAYFERIVYEENESRVGNNPLVIKAERLMNGNADIVIPNSAAQQIRINKVNFRKDCKVIVVKS